MINKKIEKAFNEQINAELYSAYLYLSMAAYFDLQNFTGFAQWMKVQAQEEVTHAMKFYEHLNGRGGSVTMKAIDTPKVKWSSSLSVFEDVYKHEVKVTGLINKLVKLAQVENDSASSIFLQWFVTEQVEEEASADYVVQMLKKVKNSPMGEVMLDRELAKRIFTPPATERGT